MRVAVTGGTHRARRWRQSSNGGAAVQVQAVEADPMLACSLPERSAGAVAIQHPHGRRPLSAGW